MFSVISNKITLLKFSCKKTRNNNNKREYKKIRKKFDKIEGFLNDTCKVYNERASTSLLNLLEDSVCPLLNDKKIKSFKGENVRHILMHHFSNIAVSAYNRENYNNEICLSEIYYWFSEEKESIKMIMEYKETNKNERNKKFLTLRDTLLSEECCKNFMSNIGNYKDFNDFISNKTSTLCYSELNGLKNNARELIEEISSKNIVNFKCEYEKLLKYIKILDLLSLNYTSAELTFHEINDVINKTGLLNKNIVLHAMVLAILINYKKIIFDLYHYQKYSCIFDTPEQ